MNTRHCGRLLSIKSVSSRFCAFFLSSSCFKISRKQWGVPSKLLISRLGTLGSPASQLSRHNCVLGQETAPQTQWLFRASISFLSSAAMSDPRSTADGRKRKGKPVRGGHRKKNRGFKGQQGGQRKERTTNYKEIEKKCPMFEKYYKALGSVPEQEWDTFMDCLRQDLPVVFRITGTKSHAKEVSKCLEDVYFKELQDIEVDGKSVEPPKPLPWYPDNVAWHVDLSRKMLRKSPELNGFHKFIVNESEQGNLTRQEAVSMIPPLLLNVKPNSRVLDMCAAPGSKTAQLIEMMDADAGTEGLLVANDKDNKRCYMLVHQTKRLNSPCLAIINEDASVLPNLFLNQQRTSPLKFDRILCDVPCSGDGTIRKNYLVWRKWNPSNGNSLHKLQRLILRRGLELLDVGGRLVYSTCSFSPVENEAVVASLLLEAGGTVETVDCSSELPGLIRRPGLSSWKVMMKDETLLDNVQAVPENLKPHFPRTMFPPDENDLPRLHLERCIRVLPHDQNTGGFFIVALHKRAPLPWMKVRAPAVETVSHAESTSADATNGTSAPSGTLTAEDGDGRTSSAVAEPASRRGPRFQKWHRGYKEDPFVFMKADGAEWQSLKSFFKIKDLEASQLLTRSYGGKKRQIYMVSPLVSNLVPNNENDIKFVNTGVRVFSHSVQKCTSACDYRLNQEGLPGILPYIHARRVNMSYEDLLMLLKNWSPHVCKLSKKTRQAVELIGSGSCIMSFNPEEDGHSVAASACPVSSLDSACPVSSPIHLCALKSRYTLRLMISQKDRIHFLMLLRQGKAEEIQAEVEDQMKQLKLAAEQRRQAGEEVPDPMEEEEAEGDDLVGESTRRTPEDDDQDDGAEINGGSDEEDEEETAEIS